MDERYLELAESLTYAQAEEEQARIRHALAQQTLPPDWDGCCTDCGTEVPAERVAATGSSRCTDCQATVERRNRLYRR